jgi:hypothetical protein
MLDYTLFNNEEQPRVGLLKKSRARIQSPGGVLSNSVQPGQGGMLPNAIDSYRSKATDLYKQGSELYDREPDFSQFQNFARQRSEQGEGDMLNALAAQYAGEGFAPVQQQYLKKAAAAREPMKMGSGVITADGEYLKDPEAAKTKKAEFLLQQAKAYETLAANAETREEQQQYRAQQDKFMNEYRAQQQQYRAQQDNAMNDLRDFMAQTGRMNAVNAANNRGGPQRAPSGYQWATTPDGQPALTFVPGGPADPVTKSAGTPSEDERKAAGWYFQADNAMRNMASVLQKNPQAAQARVPERLAGVVPVFGEDLTNLLRPEDRQKFMQAADSMSEALLRASTGAAITKAETDQKLRELIPQIGDTAGNVKQKLDSYKVYMDALRSRANRALPSGAAGAPAADNNDPFGIRSK